MRLVRVLLILLSLTGLLRAQAPRPTITDYRNEISNAIAQFENGKERYRDHDGFHRLVNAIAAKKLHLTRHEFAAMHSAGQPRSTTMRTLGFSNVSDISPDTCDENEATVAICRTNPKLIVAAANDLYAMYDSSMPAFVSTDAGRTWNTHYLPFAPGDFVQAYGDPMLTCDDKGMFYYAFMTSDANTNGSGSAISDLRVAHSTDGVNWTLGGAVVRRTAPSAIDEDKETIAVDRDPASPYYGRVYIFWSRYQSNFADKRMIAYSDDTGMTWSTPKSIPTRFGYFALLRVGKGGTIFVGSSYRNISADTGVHGMLVSHDGGKTFTDHYIASYTNFPGNLYVNGLKGQQGPKAYPYLNFDVDPANNTLYVVYGDYNLSGEYAEQYAVVSHDEGVTWSDPAQIGNPKFIESDHFQPWVTVDPITHEARISMYCSEEDASQNMMTRMVRYNFRAVDQGALSATEHLGADTFDPRKVMNPWGGAFIGDYTGGDAYGGTYVAVWTENDRAGSDGGDIMAYVESNALVVRSSVVGNEVALADPFPNPASTGTTLGIQSENEGAATLHLYDVRGREVLTVPVELAAGLANVSLNVTSLSAGVYRVTIETDRRSAATQLIVLH